MSRRFRRAREDRRNRAAAVCRIAFGIAGEASAFGKPRCTSGSDVLGSMAHIAALRNYCRPRFESDGAENAAIWKLSKASSGHRTPGNDGRATASSNDLFLNSSPDPRDSTNNIIVLTGPNMGGKSTYLRQAALIVIMAQMGSFVPARSVRWHCGSRVHAHWGERQRGRGRSTFMVEMTETAAILHTATARSLILLDEVGRHFHL